MKCQDTIKTAGKRFIDDIHAALADCALDLLRCNETKFNDPNCRSQAASACSRALDKANSGEAKLAQRIARKCDVSALSFDDVMSDAGLGFNRVAESCSSRFNDPLTDVDAISACIADQHRCEAEMLVNVENPRAGELLRLAGVPAPEGGCLPDNGGTGGNLGVNVGKDVVKCSAAIKQASAQFVTRKLKSLERCVDDVFDCVQTASDGEFDACRDDAQQRCDHEFASINDQAQKLVTSIDKKCTGLDGPLFAPEGANAQALAAECERYGVTPLVDLDDYEACLFRQHECSVEDVIEFEAPRADEMLGLVGRSLESGFCPANVVTWTDVF